MSNSYILQKSARFTRIFKKLAKKNHEVKELVRKALKQIAKDPYHQTLRTHKVITSNYDVAYSSRISKDLRIIWIFSEDDNIILLLTIGGHSGKGKVYK